LVTRNKSRSFSRLLGQDLLDRGARIGCPLQCSSSFHTSSAALFSALSSLGYKEDVPFISDATNNLLDDDDARDNDSHCDTNNDFPTIRSSIDALHLELSNTVQEILQFQQDIGRGRRHRWYSNVKFALKHESGRYLDDNSGRGWSSSGFHSRVRVQQQNHREGVDDGSDHILIDNLKHVSREFLLQGIANAPNADGAEDMPLSDDCALNDVDRRRKLDDPIDPQLEHIMALPSLSHMTNINESGRLDISSKPDSQLAGCALRRIYSEEELAPEGFDLNDIVRSNQLDNQSDELGFVDMDQDNSKDYSTPSESSKRHAMHVNSNHDRTIDTLLFSGEEVVSKDSSHHKNLLDFDSIMNDFKQVDMNPTGSGSLDFHLHSRSFPDVANSMSKAGLTWMNQQRKGRKETDSSIV
jgi:hypothetical protein